LAVLAGAGGAFFGSMGFIAGTTLVSSTFGKQDAAILNVELVKTIGWTTIKIVVIITTVVGIYLGYWAYNKVK
jgi:ABC-type antimicrobial peptide transport system permease subunit